MKKILCVIFLVIIGLFITACKWNNSIPETYGNDGRMTVIYNDGFVIIHRDNETGVQYFSRANCGSCVIVNQDGTPYTGK